MQYHLDFRNNLAHAHRTCSDGDDSYPHRNHTGSRGYGACGDPHDGCAYPDTFSPRYDTSRHEPFPRRVHRTTGRRYRLVQRRLVQLFGHAFRVVFPPPGRCGLLPVDRPSLMAEGALNSVTLCTPEPGGDIGLLGRQGLLGDPTTGASRLPIRSLVRRLAVYWP
jgi:hypothetical protein